MTSRAAGALAAMLLAGACQAGAPALSHLGPRPSPATQGALAGADSELWSGRYAEAEAAYRRSTGHDPHAEAHLAVLLAYEYRFREAVAAARQAVAERADSDTLARLARALDWAGDIPPALAAGERAVVAQPVDPVAHDYYAEALSDAGLYDLAQAQLQLAQQQARTPYEHAEAAREWGNYHRDRGEAADELSYVEIAHTYEPGFPARSVELAREYLAAQRARPREAVALLDSLLRPYAAEPDVLAAAGDAAFNAGDGSDSERYYRAALAAGTGNPRAAAGLAEDQVAIDHDPASARTTLLAAVRANPVDPQGVAEYLRQLDQLVLHRDPGGDLAGVPADPRAAGEEAAAVAAVAAYRTQLALPKVAPNPALSAASLAHAYYVLFNWGSASLAGLGVHAEQPALPGFTGTNSAERDHHFGYGGYQSSEVINHVYTAAAAVEVWADSVYHRLPITGRETADAGYGEAQVGSLAVQVMDFGVGAPASGPALGYPVPGQAGVPAAFVGNEIPDPAPDAAYPVGYPITISAGAADALTLGSATVTAPDGTHLALYSVRPGQMDLGDNELALLPRAPLTPGATYDVRVAGTLDGRPWSLHWSFTVAA